MARNFIAGTMLGLVAGAAAAMLLAPQSGDDLQNSVRQQVEQIRAEGQQAAEAKRRELEAELARTRRQATMTTGRKPDKA